MSDCTADQHGTLPAYNHHKCRCDTAIKAASRYQNLLRRDHDHGRYRIIDATTTRDQLRGLAALGWSPTLIATGITHPTVLYRVRAGDKPRCHRRVAAAVAAFYADYRDMPGPDLRVVTWARKNGWTVPPPRPTVTTLSSPGRPASGSRLRAPDVDWVAVERAVNGEPTVRLTHDEKWAVYCQLRARGHSHTAAAERLGWSGSASKVYRDRYDDQEATA